MDTLSEHYKSAGLHAALTKLKRAQRVNKLRWALSGSCFAAAVVLFLAWANPNGGIFENLLPLGMSLWLLVLGVAVLPQGYVEELRRVVAFHDVEAIGPLLDVVPVASGKHHKILKTALIELLPQLRPEDAILLNAAQRNTLTQSLIFADDDNDQDTDYRIAVLMALAQVGDGRALQPVRYIANAGYNHRVAQAAQLCLIALTERIERQKTGEMLLRPSFASEPPAELLRPVVETEAVDSRQLLRPNED